METVGGGVRTHVLQLLKNLDPERYELTLIYGERYDHVFESQREELAKHVTLILDSNLVRSAGLRASWKAVKSLRATLRRIKPDIVHCHSSIAGLVGHAAAKLEHVPKIFYTPHAYAFDAPEFSAKKRAVFGLAERVMSRWATTRTFNVSDGEYRSALRHHIDKPSKFAVIYNGVPELQLPTRAESRHRLGLDDLVPQDVPIVGVAAWLDARKDPMTFVRIAERVHDDGRNAHFVYIGSGELQDQVRDFVASHHLEGFVHLLGYRQDTSLLVRAFNVYLLPSLYEGMPYSLLESLCAGVPIVATRTTGNDEVVLPGVNGELFAVGDVAQGAAAVEKLLDDSPTFEAVKDTYRQRFTEGAMIRRITEEYEQ